MKKRFLLVVGLALILALTAIPITGCPAQPTPTTPSPTTPTPTTPTPTTPTPTTPATYEWRLSQPYPEGTLLYNTAEVFIEHVEADSNGRITIEHFPGELLGDYLVVQEAVAAGSIDFCFTWPSTDVHPGWDVFWMGFDIYNMDQAFEKYRIGGWGTAVWDAVAEMSNWKMLGAMSSGSDEIQSKELYDPVNPEGRKIRVQASAQAAAKYAAVGYSPVTMPMSEVSTALATGVIDAAAGCNHQEFAAYGEGFDYLYAVHDLWAGTPLFTNLDLWNSLSVDDQHILEHAAELAYEYGWEHFEEATVGQWNDLYDFQIVIGVDGTDWATMAQKARTAAWTEAEATAGTENVDLIRANAEPLPWGLTIDQMDYGFGIVNTEWLMARQNGVYYEDFA
jgi:TRAP-type C4-dicarboxylate transport system substrate-binding protein